MECTVTWTGHAGGQSAMGFIAETGSGHILAMDGAPDPAVAAEDAGFYGHRGYDLSAIREAHEAKTTPASAKTTKTDSRALRTRSGDRPDPAAGAAGLVGVVTLDILPLAGGVPRWRWWRPGRGDRAAPRGRAAPRQ